MIEMKQESTPPAHPAGVLAVVLTVVFSSSIAGAQTPDSEVPRTLGQDYQVFIAPEHSDDAEAYPQYPDPRGPLLLGEALSLALIRSPELAAFSWETRVQEADVLQAGLIPNPEVLVESENFVGSGQYAGYDSAETTVFLGQLVELGGKRSKRRRVADLERELSSWDYEIRRLDVLTAVTREFITVLEAQERLALVDELHKIAGQTLEAVAKQVRAGATSPVEQTRASVSFATAEVEQRRVRAELETARLRLAALWGSGRATFDRAIGELSDVFPPPALGAIQNALENNPDLARWATELEHRNAVIAVEDARAIPNITAGAGVRHFSATKDTAMVAGITIPIVLFDRNQGAKRAARFERSKARSEQRAALVRVRSALEVAYQELRASFDQLTALRESVLPQARRAYEGVRTGYLRGLFRYVDVLDSQRTLFELRDRELDALGSFHRAVAEVERLIGEPLTAASRVPAPRESK